MCVNAEAFAGSQVRRSLQKDRQQTGEAFTREKRTGPSPSLSEACLVVCQMSYRDAVFYGVLQSMKMFRSSVFGDWNCLSVLKSRGLYVSGTHLSVDVLGHMKVMFVRCFAEVLDSGQQD